MSWWRGQVVGNADRGVRFCNGGTLFPHSPPLRHDTTNGRQRQIPENTTGLDDDGRLSMKHGSYDKDQITRQPGCELPPSTPPPRSVSQSWPRSSSSFSRLDWISSLSKACLLIAECAA